METIDFSKTDRPTSLKPCVATIGFFDGVHLGHRHLIGQVVEEARQKGFPSSIITFPIHPRKVLQSDFQPTLLNGFDEKLERLASTPISYCYTLPFSQALSKMSAKEFMAKVLREQMHVDTLLIGYDHRFGHNRREGFEDYVKYGAKLGIHIIQASELVSNHGKISSSVIRNLLKNGEIMEANARLGYSYSLSGKIIQGFQVGRTIGFPTANMEVWERYKVVPALGVYAVKVSVRNHTYDGMLYIGTRPTIHNDKQISIEVNLFDFEGDLYNQSMTIEFIDFIRADHKFDDIQQLVHQIRQDKVAVENRLRK